jgi:hypothetical protein
VKRGTVIVGYAHGGEVSGEFSRTLLNVLASSKTLVYGQDVEVGGPMVADHRNYLVDRFLTTEAEWLWMVDTDMVFESDTLDRLMASAHWKHRPVVGALCFGANRRSTSIYPTMYWWTEGGIIRADSMDLRSAGLVEVDATGAACMLIHRSVLEKVCEAHPFPKGPYAFAWNNDMRVGEDINFCVRVKTAGFPIYVDCDIRVGHVKPVILDLDYYEQGKQNRDWHVQNELVLAKEKAGWPSLNTQSPLTETSPTS